MGIMAGLIGKKVALYLVDTEEPMIGQYRGTDDGFIGISENEKAPLVLVDRESVWCVIEQPATVTQ